MMLAMLFVAVAVAPHFSAISGNNSALAFAADKTEETVIFNTKTHKYHSVNCKWAIRCTKNCISLPLSEAIRRGGVPCKVCGG
jgi:hypothetical protein